MLGDQIAKQIISSTKAALSNKETLIELIFDPVPNLGEQLSRLLTVFIRSLFVR
jgi:hypothetical protein